MQAWSRDSEAHFFPAVVMSLMFEATVTVVKEEEEGDGPVYNLNLPNTRQESLISDRLTLST